MQTRNTWNDLLLSGTGTTLLEYVASIGVFNQYAIEMAFREAFLSTALRDSSIYGISRMLGISVGRKMPAIITATLTNFSASVITLPSLSKFIGQSNAFNISQLSMAPGQTAVTYLKVGTVMQATFATSNTLYNEYTLGQPGFVISDDMADMQVIIQDNLSGTQTVWSSTDSALWMYGPNDQVYWATTIDTGDVAIFFGDGTYGQVPPLNSTIIINFIITTGTAANTSLTGTTLTCATNRLLSGPISSYFSSGVDEKSAFYYKVYASHMYKSRGRCITKTDYIANIMSRNDVADVIVQGQRDLYPNDPKWTNTMRICILAEGPTDNFGGTNPQADSAQWRSFLAWLYGKNHALMTIQPWNPTPLVINVNVNIAMYSTATAAIVESDVTLNITNLFAKNMFSLGKIIYLSDIVNASKTKDVDYVDIVSPTSDIIPLNIYTYATLGTLTINCFYTKRLNIPTYGQ